MEYKKIEDSDDRMEICKKCDLLTTLNRCASCGCFMDFKVLLPSADCPEGKWIEKIA